MYIYEVKQLDTTSGEWKSKYFNTIKQVSDLTSLDKNEVVAYLNKKRNSSTLEITRSLIDTIQKPQLKYYHNNKAKINQYRETKYTCDCGCVLNTASKYRHEQSSKHREYVVFKYYDISLDDF